MQFFYGYFCSSYSQAQCYRWDSTKQISSKDSNSNSTKENIRVILGGDEGGSEGGGLKEVTFVVVLLGGGIYRMLVLLLILIFDFYMILCSRQIIYLHHFSDVRISFDLRASILHSWDLSMC